jgi:hypothetical protein
MLKGTEHGFDRTASQRHYIGPAIQPALHRLKYHLVFPSPDAPVVGWYPHRLAGQSYLQPNAMGISFRLIEDASFEILSEMLHPTGFESDGVFPRNLC